MTKPHIIIILTFFLLVSCGSKAYLFTSFHEPANEGLRLLYSYDGYKWIDFNKTFLAPQIGSKVMRDPSMVQDKNGTFHLVWTCGWKSDKGFGYASSRDLIYWSAEEFIPVMQHEDSVVNVWAPEVFADKENDQFIIIWASTIPHVFPKGEEDEYNNHRLYYTITKDFKTFSPAKLFFDPGYSSIDAVLVEKKKGDFALVFKDNTRPKRNIQAAFANQSLGPFQNVSPPFTESFTEGPSVAKVKDGWLIYFDSYKRKSYGAVKTKDFKTFTDATNEVSVPEGHKHGTIVTVKKRVIKRLKKTLSKNEL